MRAAVVADLPDLYKAVLLLHDCDGLTSDEIAHLPQLLGRGTGRLAEHQTPRVTFRLQPLGAHFRSEETSL